MKINAKQILFYAIAAILAICAVRIVMSLITGAFRLINGVFNTILGVAIIVALLAIVVFMFQYASKKFRK